MQNYVSALLSNITYLKTEDYTLKPDGTLLIYNLAESGIKPSELNFFNEYFKIESQQNGTEGFSAMKFVTIKTSDVLGIKDGDITVGFRGTEMVADDWITDIGMGMKALSDVVPKIINEASQYIPGLIGILRNLGNLSMWDEHFQSQSQQALDYFNVQKKLNNNINVLGHSLGGYLANYVTTTGDNYNYINETRTFNAPGFNNSTMAMIEIRKRLDEIINSDTSNLTGEQINDIIKEIDELSLKTGSSPFNPDSFSKLNPFYSSTGIEITSNDIVMFIPDSVNKIPVFTTPQIDPTATHGIGFLQESTALYDILNSIMKGNSVDNYNKITKMLDNYKKTTSNETLTELTLHISKYLGVESNNTFDVFNHFFNMSNEQLNTLNYDELNYSNYDKSSAYVYALINLVPIVISNELDAFQNTSYDITKYSKENLLNRFILFERYTHLNTIENFITKTVTIPTMNINENYKLIYDYNENIDLYTFVDEKNKIIMTNDFTSYRNITNNEFNFGGDLTNNIKTTYFKNNPSTLFVNTLNNIVYDTTLDDYIALNKGSTNLDLSYGNDTINVEVSNGASINKLTIKRWWCW